MRIFIAFFLLTFSAFCFSQKSLSALLKQYNDKSLPYISVQELAMHNTDAIILDTREFEEYAVSHLKGAIYVGYDFFDIDTIINRIKDKGQPIVVYCSLGIRSETIGEKLKEAGYKNVKNLYGGIFEWKNKGFEVYNSKEKITDSIHAFSKTWSKWLKKGKPILLD
ncbi:MAG: rhodanese-like domain-containing protein [Winogradskyella sp.]|uniref:rhodanese-like domain-containing protein n=1 Tax=Winogradskyella sp. TaxID=1883156 RepID=UPI00185C6B7F|nr:rhodanese-like domain-containing protein [Winogradskyella sp.]MBT8245957.1 rhodanese-like domain-containing protein [Winogradskyella sp.]NNK21767.1 rhodanese-like domain-containing protein [Winogradskyella sp.]